MTDYERRARIFKAFSDPNRLIILSFLQNGEKCACELIENLSIGQPTLSHHMRILCDAQIVQSRKLGKMTLYSLHIQGVEHAKNLLDSMTKILDNKPSAYSCSS